MSASSSGRGAGSASDISMPIFLCGIGDARQAGIEGDRGLEAELAGDLAELEDPGDLAADGLDELIALLRGVDDTVELLGLCDCGGGDVGEAGVGGHAVCEARVGGHAVREARVGAASARASAASARATRARVTSGEAPGRQRRRTGEEFPAGGGRVLAGGSHVAPTAACRAWSADSGSPGCQGPACGARCPSGTRPPPAWH